MDILGWITKHPIVTLLLLLCITVLNIESNLRAKTLNKIGIAKFSALIALFAAITFYLYNTFLHYEFTRAKFSDYEFDMTIKHYSQFEAKMDDAPRIIVIGVDQQYIDDINISAPNGGLKYNFTPRSVLANILNKFDENLNGEKPRAVLLDYFLRHTSDINSTEPKGDDAYLVDTLNRLSKKYRLMVPTLKNKLFIEDFAPDVELTYTATLHNVDGVARGFAPYLCRYDGKKIPHIARVLYNDEQGGAECKDFNRSDYDAVFKNRIIYKQLDGVVSKYPNIVYYSATELGNIFEEFEDAIVLIGSNYAASGDIHKTPLGDGRSGVFVIADMINTSYLTGGNGLKVANWIVLLIFYTSSVFVLTYIVLKITHKSSDDDKRFYKLAFMSSKEKVIYIVNIIFFASCSAVVWYYYGYWISWIVPIMVFMLIDYGIFLIFYSAAAICNKIKILYFQKKRKNDRTNKSSV